MSDPLSLLRQATVNGVTIQLVNGNYVLGAVQLPENTPTSFRRTVAGTDYYYTLKDIVFFLENIELSEPEYRKKSFERRDDNISAVVKSDRNDLKNYLTGAINTCTQIDQQIAANYQFPSSVMVSTVNEPTMSVEKMQEQRERYAAQMEKTLQKTKAASSGADAVDSLKHLKRKSQAAFGGEAGEDEGIDRQFLLADRQILAKLRSDELPANTRSTVLNAPNTDFSIVLKLFNDKVLRPMQASVKPVAPAAVSASASKRAPETKPAAAATAAAAAPAREAAPSSGAVRTYPIIIVPGSLTSCVTLINAKDFLLDGVYYSVEEKRKAGATKNRDSDGILLIRELPNGGRLVYKVIDDPTKLSDEDWDRVVAVFATGQAWQFKGWKYPSPVTLFQNVLGVHVCIDSAVVDANIQSWNCKVLKINLFKQHLNAGASKEFWMFLDDYMKLRKPFLLPGARPRVAAAPASGSTSHHSAARSASHGTSAHSGAHRSSGSSGAARPAVPSASSGSAAAATSVPPPPPPQFRAPAAPAVN